MTKTLDRASEFKMPAHYYHKHMRPTWGNEYVFTSGVRCLWKMCGQDMQIGTRDF